MTWWPWLRMRRTGTAAMEREVRREDPDLHCPSSCPRAGYSCDVVRNVPSGLQEFLDPLCQRWVAFSQGVCTPCVTAGRARCVLTCVRPPPCVHARCASGKVGARGGGMRSVVTWGQSQA